jgi:hypothetical protein
MDSFSCRSPVFPEVDFVRDFSLLQKKIKFRVLGVLFYVIFGNKKTRNFIERNGKEPKKTVMPSEERMIKLRVLGCICQKYVILLTNVGFMLAIDRGKVVEQDDVSENSLVWQ